MNLIHIDYKDKIAYSEEKANKIALGEGAHSRTTLWCLKPGQHIHAHVHAGDHIWIVLEGKGRYLCDGEPLPIAPGRVLIIPAGLSHGVENSGSEGLVFASISAG